MGILIYPCAWLFVCLNPASAQDVWELDSSISPGIAHLDVSTLETLEIGDTFTLQVDGDIDSYTVRIDSFFTLDNGDHAWYGTLTKLGLSEIGLDYALVVTAGNKTAHLILTSPSGIFQLFGQATGDGIYSGPFNRLEHVRDPVSVSDTLNIPDAMQGSDPVFTASGLTIDQRASRQSAPIGSSLSFVLDFTNHGTAKLSNQYVDIFFVLENTSRYQLPDNCQILPSTDLLPVLRCELGDIAAGQARHLTFTVSTSEESYPLVYSTAVVDEVRSDVIVEIFHDVLTDSDEDGISDFNEALVGLDPLDGMDALSEQVTIIDVLVAYTADLDGIYQGEVDTRINQVFNVANKIFEDSETGIRLRPVGVHRVDYTPATDLAADLSVLTYRRKDSLLVDLDRKRLLYGGDLVVLFRSGEENGLCGLANLGGRGTQGDLSAYYWKDFAYSVINLDCMDDSVLAHEVGHNLGLVHSRREESAGGTLPFSAGYGRDTRFVTVMAFPDDFNVEKRLYRFSDPSRSCGPFQCGADKEDAEEGADAVATLKLVKHQVAAYFSSQEQRISSLKAVSSQSGVIQASLGVGAYRRDGDSFESSFTSDEAVNLRIKIRPLPGQVGKEFVAHMVIASGKGHYLQVTADGTLKAWDGELATLEAATTPRAMQANELFDVVEDLEFGSMELSGTLNIFVAYQILATGELVYSGTPYKLSVSP